MNTPRTSPRPRRQQRALETRGALLDTATREFSTRGFDGVSVRQLEELAGVKRGLVAYHFQDKAQLWREAIDRLFGDMEEELLALARALVDVAPREAARALARAFIRYSALHPELNRLMMQESLQDSWRVAYIVDEKIRPLLEAFAGTMPEATGMVWGEADPHRYYMFVGAGAFVFSAELECRRLFGVSPREEAFVDEHADMVLDLLLPR